jgi:hypothetical protein
MGAQGVGRALRLLPVTGAQGIVGAWGLRRNPQGPQGRSDSGAPQSPVCIFRLRDAEAEKTDAPELSGIIMVM